MNERTLYGMYYRMLLLFCFGKVLCGHDTRESCHCLDATALETMAKT